MPRIVPHLWYTDRAEEAARFYASVVPDSHVDSVTTMPAESPAGPEGSVTIVAFTLAGRPFSAFSAGKLDDFNHAISLMIECDTQDEIDRLWDALSEGGQVEQCGWLRDRYGLCWQVVPEAMGGMMAHPDHERVRRVTEAMLQMVKFDIAGLESAFHGGAVAH